MTTEIFPPTLETLARALEGYPFPTATFVVEGAALRFLAVSNHNKISHQSESQKKINVTPSQLQEKLQKLSQSLFWLNGEEKIYSVSADATTIPELFGVASQLGYEKVSFLQVSNESDLYGLVMVGCYENQVLTQKKLQPCLSLVQLACSAIEKEAIVEQAKISIKKTETLSAITSAIKTPWDTEAFFAALHDQIKQSIGDYSFTAALYDEKTNSIQIPYMDEGGAVQPVASFPLGEGLTSVLIRSKQPLLLAENPEEQSKALGAKANGKPAKSWMGTPLIIEDQAIGALIVQDLERENAFSKDHLDYLTDLSRQVSGIIFNARLLDEHRSQTAKIQTATEIARDISSALNLDELLLKAVNLIHDRFDFYHAAIFLKDNAGANVVVREATGEAGAQMKRISHKLSIGSKSVVGFVAGQGESLIVNDTAQDATHLPNPLLPNTRAEAAIPLKIGDRILGVLDVQSTIPFAFSPNDLNTLQILADQLAIAVNNSELFAETQEHLSQHRLLHHITTLAASGTTLEESLNSTVKGLQVTLGGDRVSILLTDSDRKNLVIKAWVGYSEEATDLKIPIGSGITGWVAVHRKPLRVDDIRQDARYIEVSSNTRSELALPLIFQNDVLGVLNVESEQVAAYTENDVEMLGTLAGSLAAIIANARLVEQIRKQAERERLLYEITSKIRRSTDMQTILSTTISEINRVTGARRTQISVGIKKDEAASARVKPSNNKEQ